MSQLNCFIFVCKKSKLKEGLKRWTNQAFWFLSSILTSPKNILTPRSHACFPCRTGGHTHNPPLEKRTRFKTNYYIYAYVRALCRNVRATLYLAMWIYVRGILRDETVGTHAELFTCYMSPAQRHLQLMGAITTSRGLQKSESLRAGLRYCCCGLGDNYLMNKLPKPLAKHTSYST